MISFDGVKNLGNIIKGNFVSLEYKKGEPNNIFTAVNKKDINSHPFNFKNRFIN
ncbi:MAG: hypothetical protein R2837_09635 [Aliarcobacter sp.]